MIIRLLLFRKYTHHLLSIYLSGFLPVKTEIKPYFAPSVSMFATKLSQKRMSGTNLVGKYKDIQFVAKEGRIVFVYVYYLRSYSECELCLLII